MGAIGLAGLVPLAELLGSLAGGRQGAVTLAANILVGTGLGSGEAALPHNHGDVGVAVQAEMARTGVVAGGKVQPGRAAELVAVCQILAAAREETPAPPAEAQLVFSAPPGMVVLEDRERLEGLVIDVVRQATTSLVIGGPFWNDAGFEILEDVLGPALSARRVATTVYANPPGPEHEEVLDRRLARLRALGPLQVRWFTGARPTMLHAKFVIRDRRRGYLGSANLTSWGMQNHIEAGVELSEAQSRRFAEFLEQLELAGLFSDRAACRPGD